MATQNLLTPESVQLVGGLDFVTPRPTVAPGSLIDCYNFEVADRLGYKRVDGIERFDGSTSSALTYTSLYTMIVSPFGGTPPTITPGSYIWPYDAYTNFSTKSGAFGVVTSVSSIVGGNNQLVNFILINDESLFSLIAISGVSGSKIIWFDSDSSFAGIVTDVGEYSFSRSSSGFYLPGSVQTVLDSVTGAAEENIAIESTKQACVTGNYCAGNNTAPSPPYTTNTAIGLHWFNDRLYAIHDLCMLYFSLGNSQIYPNDTLNIGPSTLVVRDIRVISGSWDTSDAAGFILFTGIPGKYNSKANGVFRGIDDTASIDVFRGTATITGAAQVTAYGGVDVPKAWYAGLSYGLNDSDLRSLDNGNATQVYQGFTDIELGYNFTYKDGTSNGPPSIVVRDAIPSSTSKSYTSDAFPTTVTVDSGTISPSTSIGITTSLVYTGSSAAASVQTRNDNVYIYPIIVNHSPIGASKGYMYFSDFGVSGIVDGALISDVSVTISGFGNSDVVSDGFWKFFVSLTVDGVNYSTVRSTTAITSSSGSSTNIFTLGGSGDIWAVPGLNADTLPNLKARVQLSNKWGGFGAPRLAYVDSISVSVGFQKYYGIYYFNNGTDDIQAVISNVWQDPSTGGDWTTNNSSGAMQVVSLQGAPLLPPVQTAASTSTSGGSGLSASTPYYYVVTALGTTGETVISNEKTVTTGLGTTNSNTVNWNATYGATGYKVYRGTTSQGENQVVTLGNVLTLHDVGTATGWTSGTPPTTNSAVSTSRAAIFSGDKIYTAPGQGGNLIATVSSDMKYSGLAAKQDLEANKSRYEIIDANFYGNNAWAAMYGCSGAGRAFVFDGTYVRTIYTGLVESVDLPRHIAFHNFHLLLGYNSGACLSSVAGSPEDFNGVNGAAEFDTGDAITGILRLSGTSLGLFCTKSIQILNGTDNTNFSISTFNPYEGAIEYTVLDCGKPVWCSYRGISTLDQSAAYGNFEGNRLSFNINPWLLPRITNQTVYSVGTSEVSANTLSKASSGILFAMPVRAKNQYKLAFADGYWLTMTFQGPDQVPVFTIQQYKTTRTPGLSGSTITLVPQAVSYSVDTKGKDRNHMSVVNDALFIQGDNSVNTDHWYIWELDRGYSFGGETPVEGWITTTHNFFDNPFQEMTVRNVRLHGQSLGLATLGMAVSADYLSNDFTFGNIYGQTATNAPVQDISLPRDGGSNPYTYRLGDYLAETNIASAGKTGRSFSLQFSTAPASIEPPSILQQLLFQLSAGKADIK